MGVLEDFSRLIGWSGEWADPPTRALFTRFDDGGRPGADGTERRMYAYWAQFRLSLAFRAGRGLDPALLAVVRDIAGGDTPWAAQDAVFLWSVAYSLRAWRHPDFEEVYRIPTSIARSLDYPDRRRVLMDPYDWSRKHDKEAWEALGERLTDLLTEPAANGPAGVVRNLIWDLDPIARAMAEDYGPRLAAPAVLPLLKHWVRTRSGKPGDKWLEKAGRLLTDEAVTVLRDILTRVAAHRETPAERRITAHGERALTVFLDERTILPVRGMVWTCELIDRPWVPGLLGDLAVTCGTGFGGTGANCRSEKLANAAVNVLARRGGLDTVSPLARVQVKVRRKSVLAGVAETLDAVAAAAGLSREQLLDRTVPAFGLDADGVREEKIGGHLVRLHADGPALSFVNPAGRAVKSAPQAIRKDPALAELKATLKELKQTLPAERFRLERALIEERRWDWAQVTELFLDHPVTGRYARDLIWQMGQGFAGLPVRTETGWELAGPHGGRARPGPKSPIRLWHPIREPVEDVRAWRDHLLELGVRQPYKQAFREIYLLTPAEEETRTLSNRFAGHVLRYGQAKALLNQRGWRDLSIGHWDYECGGNEGEAVKELSGWRVRWGMHVTGDPEADGWGSASFCETEALRFQRAGSLSLGDAPLAEVPPLVLSEVLRDADLAVGVASLGLADQAMPGHEDYWHSYGFGELQESARMRRDALSRLLPRLKIAGRVELTDRFLRVRGDRRTYKIHLGSGNILMEPNDAYLCIVPGPGRPAQAVFLPFEEDGGMLSVILSKAFLLAGDAAITDPSITRQLVLT
ncbi:DUF4132 domain-containing protein [Nonomuraea zeae]|uniref:DUF4132 domain-containing protein n=1 Tax=Nonomuraea zeae TaxID=1642303 RepID=A0A5S4FP97_9ACTN|nr:DUF4132 domain-containing protein [Nonomuraea zeae]TMR22506.1 DUF4132 domain-containing protein [Nonomuraea zeae]